MPSGSNYSRGGHCSGGASIPLWLSGERGQGRVYVPRPPRVDKVMLALGVDDERVETTTDFDSFFRTHFGRVARAAALVARDPGTGQDLAQEAFARLFERWGTDADGSNLHRVTDWEGFDRSRCGLPTDSGSRSPATGKPLPNSSRGIG